MLSVVLSLYIYFISEDQMLGIFVGLWAPTLILATKEFESLLDKSSEWFDNFTPNLANLGLTSMSAYELKP